MNLIESIDQKAIQAACNFKKSEALLVLAVLEVDSHKVFRELGFSSLHDYCLRRLHLSESNAFNVITVARKSAALPELKKEIVNGNLTVSQARRITPILTEENQALWIEKAKTLSQRNLEKEIAKERPQALTPERMRYVSGERLKLECGISEELMKKIKRVQDLLAKKHHKAISIEEALEATTELYLDREDPIRKAERSKNKSPDSSQPGLRKGKRTSVPKPIEHQVMLRDQGRCTYVDARGGRCEETRFIQLHHRKEISQGGMHCENNLEILCFHHHRHRHLGIG
jgi:5-methylcytosine-specific restriction endonuclease McrA